MRRIRRQWEGALGWFSSEESRGLYEFAQHLFAVSLVLLEMSHRFHDVFPWVPQWDRLYLFAIGLGLLLIVITWTMRLIFRHSPGINRLDANLTTGRLRGRLLGEANVALRRQTVERILDGVLKPGPSGQDRSGVLFETCCIIGRDFAETFLSQRDSLGHAALKQLLLYDSSSGMGHFESEEYTEHRIAITVSNSFTEKTPFLTGYLSGICSQITGSDVKNVQPTRLGPGHFKFEITF